MKISHSIEFLLLLLSITSISYSLNKYSKEANVRQTENPFRVLKLNELWTKAMKVRLFVIQFFVTSSHYLVSNSNQRLDGQKLKNLKSDLKTHDKEELALKKLRADNQDKDGVREAHVRRQLSAILQKYGLDDYYKSSDHLDNNSQRMSNKLSDEYIDKQIFSDKKLDKLWKKAQISGLNDEELKILKEEFRHHEEKISQYNQLIGDINKREELKRAKGIDWENSVNRIVGDDEELNVSADIDSHQALKDKHFEIKQNYKRLSEQILLSGDSLKTANDEFEEEKVQKLWELALKSAFDHDELMSLRQELDHYQNRIRKLKHFESELEIDSIAGKAINENIDSLDGDKHLQKKVKELNHKVTKLHNDLETRIMQRHIEL